MKFALLSYKNETGMFPGKLHLVFLNTKLRLHVPQFMILYSDD